MSTTDMWSRVSWMVGADESILRILGSPKKLELNPGVIAHNTGFSRSHVHKRLNVLVSAGLVDKVEVEDSFPHYTTTELGESFVQGRLSSEDLEELYSPEE